MNATTEWTGELRFEGRSESGHVVVFDAGAEHAAGASPMEAVLAALCACTSVDVVNILRKKRMELRSLRVRAEAKRAENSPRVFTRIRLTYTAAGTGLTRKAVEDAVALSEGKYCSVSRMLAGTVAITTAVEFAEDV